MSILHFDGLKIKGLTLTGGKSTDAIKTRKEIVSLFSEWFWLVTDYGWIVTIHYVDDYSDMVEGADKYTAMRTTATYCYLRADIYVNLEICARQSGEFLLEAVVHELTHLLVSPMLNDDQQRMEYTVTSISRALVKARKE